MYLSQWRKFDVANGPGVRTTIFVSGCTHNCPDCFNKDYFNFKNGQPWTQELQSEIIEHIRANRNVIKGLTVLGGEPFQQTKDKDLVNFLKVIRKEFPALSVWIFSGYTFDEIIEDDNKLEILKLCDILVDGLFMKDLKDVTLKFRGSTNQRIIDIEKSLETKQICEEQKYI